jgi:hypothetical protein
VARCTWDSDDVADGDCVDMMAVVAVEVKVAVTVVQALAYVVAVGGGGDCWGRGGRR